MKNLLTLFCAMFVFAAGAQTTNWYVDGNLYQTTSCTSGDNVTPPTAPAKHGYTFVGWYDSDVVVGTWAQSGTPSPTNPIEPTFYQNGNLILRAIGTGDDLIADTYNTATGKIMRHVGVMVLDGTETMLKGTYGTMGTRIAIEIPGSVVASSLPAVISHYQDVIFSTGNNINNSAFLAGYSGTYGGIFIRDDSRAEVADMRQFLSDQYAAGTPVTIYYPLATPTEETYTPAQ